MDSYHTLTNMIMIWLVLTCVTFFHHGKLYAQKETDFMSTLDTLQHTPWPHWNKKAVETLRLNEDSTFYWETIASLSPGQNTNVFGQGTYFILGDTLVLNSNFHNSLEIVCKKEKKYNKKKRKIEIEPRIKGNIVWQAVLVLYVNEDGDTIFANNLHNPDFWPYQSTPRLNVIELDHPKDIIDILVYYPWILRPTRGQMQTINHHNGDIELICHFAKTNSVRMFDCEKWTFNGDTIYPLTVDGYKSAYPLVRKDSVYMSTRVDLGKPYDGEFYGSKAGDGTSFYFGHNREKVHYNSKYYREAIVNGFKTYGLITRDKYYDVNGRVVAEGEYLSDTYNPFLRWYKYIKVGRWKYYDPDGTIRYVNY